jgi:hypothetical protein
MEPSHNATPKDSNMTTAAQRILSNHNTAHFAGQQALESELREIASKVEGGNCYDRTWTFTDGSTITKTREGFTTGGAK